MEELLKKIVSFGINIDTNSLVEIARCWFWRDIIHNAIDNITWLVTVGVIAFIGFRVARNYGTGKWKWDS